MVREVENQKNSNVLGFEINGKVTGEDVEQVERAIENKLQTNDKVRIYTEIKDHDGWSFSGFFKDLKQKMKYAGKIEKAAIIADDDWKASAESSDLFASGEVERFDLSQSQQAKEWLKGPKFSDKNRSTSGLTSASNQNTPGTSSSSRSTLGSQATATSQAHGQGTSQSTLGLNNPSSDKSDLSSGVSRSRSETQSYSETPSTSRSSLGSSSSTHSSQEKSSESYSDNSNRRGSSDLDSISNANLTNSNDLSSTDKSSISQTNNSDRQYGDNSPTRSDRDFSTSSNPDASYQNRYDKEGQSQSQFSSEKRDDSDPDTTFNKPSETRSTNENGYNSGTSYTSGETRS